MKRVDARGLSCPQPMLMAKKAMQAGDDSTIEVLVDCAASVENIGRVAEQLHWNMTAREDGAETVLELQRGQN